MTPSAIPIRATDNVVAHRRAARTSASPTCARLFWPELGLTKGDLLQYYADVARVLLPHIHDRAMVMKRYPHGAAGRFFFMKRAPSPRPAWIETCPIDHGSGNVIDFPVIQDLPSLLWVVNLGCIDLNQWYAPGDDVDRPDYLHFDLDPGTGASFERVLEAGLVVREALDALKMPSRREDDRLEGTAHLHPDRERPGAERGVDVCKGPRPRAGVPAPAADDSRISRGETARGAACSSTTTRMRGAGRSRRLFRASASGRRRVDPGHLEGS